MEVEEIVGASQVLVVAGKGGVGKTTVGATAAVAAARAGADVLVVELEGRSQLAELLGGGPLGFEPTLLAGSDLTGGGQIAARRITPDEALADYLGAHGLDRITNRRAMTSVVDVVTTAAVGLRDLLALGKIRQLADRSVADLIVVDGPAAGHAIAFLQTPASLVRASLGGPVHRQAEAALSFLGDEGRCRVQLVCIPEATPVTELIDTAYALEDHVGVALAPVVVNCVRRSLRGLISAARSTALPSTTSAVVSERVTIERTQAAQLSRLADALPLPRVELPFIPSARLGTDDVLALADHFRVAAPPPANRPRDDVG